MSLTVAWSVLGLLAWVWGSRQGQRTVWLGGAIMMGIVLAKLLPHHRTELTLPLPAISVGAGNNIWAPTVKRLFALTQMKAEVGATYSVEVDDGEVSLGKRTVEPENERCEGAA